LDSWRRAIWLLKKHKVVGAGHGKIIPFFIAYFKRKRPIAQDSTLTSVPREDIIRGLREEVEDLDLDFNLPCSFVLELKNNGTAEPVSLRICVTIRGNIASCFVY
jgi:hypothetical protein